MPSATLVPDDVTELSLTEPLIRLSRDLREASTKMSRVQVRWTVHRYYSAQDERKRAANQVRASKEAEEPNDLLDWSLVAARRFEGGLKASLGEFAASYRVGQWLQSLFAVGPVISAAVLSFFDIRKAPTVGHMWRFAGLDPSLKWPGKQGATDLLKEVLGDSKEVTPAHAQKIQEATGQHVANVLRIFEEGYETKAGRHKGRKAVESWLAKRPWHGPLKALCLFGIGETQVKFCNHEKSYYGPLYSQYKANLTAANERGDFAELAAQRLREEKIGKGTDCYKHLTNGVLPPGQIHNRARRWMVKLFLSHSHEVMYWDFHGKAPPAPFVFEHPTNGDHRHKLVVPGWPGEFDGRPLTALRG